MNDSKLDPFAVFVSLEWSSILNKTAAYFKILSKLKRLLFLKEVLVDREQHRSHLTPTQLIIATTATT